MAGGIDMSGDLARRRYCDSLMLLCEQQKLASITATSVIREAGTARQTFYNYFSDINDLIGYIPINFMETFGNPTYFAETVYEAYRYAMDNKAFFCQLPFHSGQNNFRDTFVSFMRDSLRASFVSDSMEESERIYREIAIEQTVIGVTDTFLEWCRNQMGWPVDILVRVQYDMSPAFVRDAQMLPVALRRVR